MTDIAERIFNLLKEKGIEQKKFATLIGTTDKTVSAWKNERSASYNKKLSQIAEVLDTSVEYLLNGEEKGPVQNSPSKSALMAAFWGGEKDLSQEDLEAMWSDVERFAQFIAEKKKQEKKNRD